MDPSKEKRKGERQTCEVCISCSFFNRGSSHSATVTDFSTDGVRLISETSYIPGTVSSPLHELLPKSITEGLQKSLLVFNNKMRGYFTEEAQILAAETRTSSPIRIPRNNETMMHIEIEGLFPSGEGAGYAGGIVSAAIDGENCANAVSKYFNI